MRIQHLSPLLRRAPKGGGGRSGGGGKSRSSSSKGSTGGGKPVAISGITLPGNNKNIKTYGSGGGKSVTVHDGTWGGWTVDSPSRGSGVYANSTHPIPPHEKTLPWGFIPIAVFFSVDAAVISYYESLPEKYTPQNTSRPGGALLEMALTPSNATVPPSKFIFVADNKTVFQINNTVSENCTTHWTTSTPIAFNSTGNLLPESVLQYYRGESAVVLLQGYDNTKEQPNSPNLVPNPPMSSNVSAEAWECLNVTIGESIPIMQRSSGLSRGTVVDLASSFASAAFFLLALLCYLLYGTIRELWVGCSKKKGGDSESASNCNPVGEPRFAWTHR